MAGPSRIDELRKKFDENPRRYFAPLANEYRKLGDFEQAIFICQEFLPQQPGHMSGHIVYGQALFEAGRHDEARTVFETALSLDPENLIALRHLGDIARAHGDIETARAWYRRVLDSDPRNEEIAGILQTLDSDVVEAALAPSAEVGPAVTVGESPTAGAGAANEPPPGGGRTEQQVSGTAQSPAAEAQSPQSAPPEPSPTPAFSPLAGLMSNSDAPPGPPPSFEQEADLDALFPTSTAASGGNMYQDAPPLEAPEGPLPVESLLDIPNATPAAPAFVTETMAELYLQQGHRDEAIDVYRQLAALHPDDEAVRSKLRTLEIEAAAGAPPPTAETRREAREAREAAPPIEPEPRQAPAPSRAAPEPPPVIPAPEEADEGPTIRDFLAALALWRPRASGSGEPDQAHAYEHVPATSGEAVVERPVAAADQRMPSSAPPPPAPASSGRSTGTVGGSLDALFQGAEGPHRDSERSPLEAAFSKDIADRTGVDEGDAALRGRPATPAASELSLDHVFRRATPGAGSPAQGGGFSFDQFFSQQARADAANVAEEPKRESESSETDDIQQFNAWLEGLKKS